MNNQPFKVEHPRSNLTVSNVLRVLEKGYSLFRITYAPELENSWNAISACAAWAGAFGTVAAVWFAVLSSEKQYRLSDKQQKQNTGLNLYPERRNVLRLLQEGKYDDVYWDAVILFSPKIADEVLNLQYCEKRYKEYCGLVDQYEHEMKEHDLGLYQKYVQLVSQEDTSDDILNLCDKFKPFVCVSGLGEQMCLDYRELSKNVVRMKWQRDYRHFKVFQLMKNEIKSSIFNGE